MQSGILKRVVREEFFVEGKEESHRKTWEEVFRRISKFKVPEARITSTTEGVKCSTH